MLADVGEVLRAVQFVAQKDAQFRSTLERLTRTLNNIKPIYDDIRRLSTELNRPEEDTESFTRCLDECKRLVDKCSRISWWNQSKRFLYLGELRKLDAEFVRLIQVDGQVWMMRETLRNALHQQQQMVSANSGATTRCAVPGLPAGIVGFDMHLEALKRMLFDDDAATTAVVVSAPGGCGKTTLAKMICNEDDIKGKYHILYVIVSKTKSLRTLFWKLFKEDQGDGFQTDEDAKIKLESNLRDIKKPILLVLDDVWPESESVIKNFKFPIPRFKILVTSRSSIPSFGTTYRLKLLNDADARTLLCKSAFPEGRIPTDFPDELVTKVVKACNGFPLALIVIGASLCGRKEATWEATLMESILSHNVVNEELLPMLQASVDALHKLPYKVKDCYLDLGSFPEDEKIAATALLDMWVELYEDLDEKGKRIFANLEILEERNLINLFATSENATKREGYCDEHFVTQHDLLRELVIHLSNEAPIAQRNRLFLEINGNAFPKWWSEQNQQPAQTRLLSISTDETFDSRWHDLHLPALEVLILNLRTREYTLPKFLERLNKLKVLIITNYGFCNSLLSNFPSIGSLSNLRRIRFQRVSIPSLDVKFLQLENLKKISFIMCELSTAFKNFAAESYMLPSLVELEIDRCDDLKELPSQLCNIAGLKKLRITYCHELSALPDGLGRLANLEALILNPCTKLEKLPESIGNLHKLSFLDITDCLGITELPMEMGQLSGLEVLRMSGCRGLSELPTSVTSLSKLKKVICDEETSCLWREYEQDLENLKIHVAKEDIFGSFRKVFPLGMTDGSV